MKIVIIGSAGAGKSTFARELIDDQQPEPEQKHDQPSAKVKERLQSCLPDDPKSCLFTLVAVVYLIVAVIHYFQSGDTSMLTTLFASAGAYVGLPKIKTALSPYRRKGRDN